MTRLLLVALGGALGASARYGLGLAAMRLAPNAAWPWATFTVNVLGGLVMGLLAGWLAKTGDPGETWRLLLGVGLLGGFTTFSAFGLETAQLLRRGEWLVASGYVGGSVLLGLALVLLGMLVAGPAG